MWRRLASLALVCLLAGPLGAQVRLDPDTARLVAAEYITQRNGSAAAEISGALITRDPRDITAWILHARAHRLTGEFGTATMAARRAWRLADTPVERYASARLMAQVLSSADRKTRAQAWLRRAVQLAPDERTRAQAISDYRFVRAVNPWDISFSFGIEPSDNVNNAPRDNTIILGGLVFTNPTLVPLSGTRVSAGLRLRYNFGVSRTERTFVALDWDETQVQLSSSARAAVPTARGSDFDYRRVGLRVGADFAAGPQGPRSTIFAEVSQSDYGGDPLSDDLRFGMRQTRLREGGRRFDWSATLGRSNRRDTDLRSATIATATVGWTIPLKGGARLGYDLRLENQASDSAAVAHHAATLGLSLAAAKPILGARVFGRLEAGARLFDRSLYGPDPREDDTLRLQAIFLFQSLELYGFAPKLTLEARRTNSNVTRFETESLAVSLSVGSVF